MLKNEGVLIVENLSGRQGKMDSIDGAVPVP